MRCKQQVLDTWWLDGSSSHHLQGWCASSRSLEFNLLQLCVCVCCVVMHVFAHCKWEGDKCKELAERMMLHILDGSSFLVSGLHSLRTPSLSESGCVFSVPEAQGKGLKMLRKSLYFLVHQHVAIFKRNLGFLWTYPVVDHRLSLKQDFFLLVLHTVALL
jgi:hypothetical protein